MTISLCMIVKNEQAVLARCLDSIKAAVDEIIIVDTGSTDETKRIAALYTDQIYDFEWVDDFSAARNYAYSFATMDYQLWMDADDILPEHELNKLITIKKTLPPDTDMVTMKYHTHFDKNLNPILTSTRERLTKREKGYQWMDPIHECIPLTGNILHSDIAFWHKKPLGHEDSNRNLNIYEKLEASGKTLSPRQQYYFARELRDHRNYAKSAYYFERFIDERRGWVEDNIASCHALAQCYRALHATEQIVPILIKSFNYDAPRAEILCELGYHYKRQGDYKRALKWFKAATLLDPPDALGFILEDYWGYIPNIECCVCLCSLERYEEALRYNTAAGEFKPGDDGILHNDHYIRSILETQCQTQQQ